MITEGAKRVICEPNSCAWKRTIVECLWHVLLNVAKSGIMLGMGSANEGRRYNVTSSLIGWAHTQNDLCMYTLARVYNYWYLYMYITWPRFH